MLLSSFHPSKIVVWNNLKSIKNISFYFTCNTYALKHVENSTNKESAQDAVGKYNTKFKKINYVIPKDIT